MSEKCTEGYHVDFGHHFLQHVWRAYSICEIVVIRVNSGHRDIRVSLNVTDGGNLVGEAVKERHKLRRDEHNMPQIEF